MRPILLALLAIALAAADPVAPDRLDVHAAVGVGGPSRAALFAGIKAVDDGRIRVAAGTIAHLPGGGDTLAVTATDIADGAQITDYTDRRQTPEPIAVTLTDGRIATVRAYRPSVGPMVLVVTAIAPKASP